MPIPSEVWGTHPNGETAHAFHLNNDHLKVTLTNYGASLVSVEMPNADGEWQNIMITAEAEQCLSGGSPLGITVGRFANRIGKGKFTLNDNEYNLAINNGPNSLHGGKVGFAKKMWTANNNVDNSIAFKLVSPDGDEGYPGELTVLLTYLLDGNKLILSYEATTTAPTVLNLTNHGYWNLSGDGTRTVYDHSLQVFADQYLENDENVLPTGHVLDVANTCFDFRKPKRVGKEIDQTTTSGYDNCFCINEWDQTERVAAIISEPTSGRTMKVSTTEPGVQLYTANHFRGNKASGGAIQHGAFCLECQHYPDSPNLPAFPTTELNLGETYRQVTTHEFTLPE